MTGLSFGAARAIAKRFPWKEYKTFVDVGCAHGCVPVQVALAHPHLTGKGMDLPVVQPIFESYMREQGLETRIVRVSGEGWELVRWRSLDHEGSAGVGCPRRAPLHIRAVRDILPP